MSNRKRLLLIPILAGLALVSCDPIATDNSSQQVDPGSQVSPDGHNHSASPTWSYDETNHWHECTICGTPLNVAAHTFDDGEVIVSPNEQQAGTRRFTCSVCSYHYDVTIPPLEGDVLEKMNEKLALHTDPFIDHYEVRDYLLDNGYDTTASLDDGTKYGYSEVHNKVVEYKNNAVTRPTECIGDSYYDYSSVTVSTFDGLVNTINSLNNGTASYASIKLGDNITQLATSNLAQYRGTKPLEIDLKGHSILAPNAVDKDYNTSKWFTLQFLDTTISSNVYIHGGQGSVIEANRLPKADGIEDDACSLSLVAAKTFRIENIKLLAKNGTQCIGDLSQYINNYNSKTKKVYISHVDMEAPLRAMSIAGGDWKIDNCPSILGMVAIDGGTVAIDNCTVDASNALIPSLNAYESGYTNAQLEVQIVDYLNGKEYNRSVKQVLTSYVGAVSFNDAISVISRRSSNYSVASVSVRNSTLIPVMVNNVPTGYGFRYWDVNGNVSASPINPILENNSYPNFDPVTSFGGSNYISA